MFSCCSYIKSEDFLPIVDSQILGVARVVIQSGYMPPKRIPSPIHLNPFVKITTDVCEQSFRTSRLSHTRSPNWLQETLYIPVSSQDSAIHFSMRSRSTFLGTRIIGSASLPLGHVLDTARDQHSITLPLYSKGHEIECGQMLISVSFCPVLAEEHPSVVGIVRLILYEAKDLNHARTHINPSPRALVQSIVESQDEDRPNRMFSTPISRDTTEPAWNSCYDFICVHKLETTLLVHVMDADAKDSELGTMRIPLRDVLDTSETDTVWWPLMGSTKGQLKMRAQWRAVAIPEL